jgi:hypothetical protein
MVTVIEKLVEGWLAKEEKKEGEGSHKAFQEVTERLNRLEAEERRREAEEQRRELERKEEVKQITGQLAQIMSVISGLNHRVGEKTQL